MRGLKPDLTADAILDMRRTRMGAWIETCSTKSHTCSTVVAPVWVRGLKPLEHVCQSRAGCRTRMGAWIETQLGRVQSIAASVAPVWVRGLKLERGS